MTALTLIKKPGIKPGMKISNIEVPNDLFGIHADLPDENLENEGLKDYIHDFISTRWTR
jgi:hypothetical protein